MKVLWITNILFPDINNFLGGKFCPAGGWMLSLAEQLKRIPNVELSIATVTPLCKDIKVYVSDNIRYYAIPIGKGNITYNKEYEFYWQFIENDFRPDVVHIHGTEFTHGLSYVQVYGAQKVVVSIQGLITEIAKYSKGGLTNREIFNSLTIRDLISKTDLISESIRYYERARWERLLLSKVNHVIGRTVWDKKCVMAINPSLEYYSVNESMRDEFYDGLWTYEACKMHSIFLSQASCALKGAHFVFMALPKIIKEYPDTTIRIAGNDIIKINSLKDYLKQTNYSKYLRKLIKDLNINERIEFLGVLNAEEMKTEYLSANLFICPSSIENSPNSVGEAQLLGVPILASNVGGVSSIIDTSITYDFNNIELLQLHISEIFRNSSDFDNRQQRYDARVRYDRKNNLNHLINIYKKISNN